MGGMQNVVPCAMCATFKLLGPLTYTVNVRVLRKGHTWYGDVGIAMNPGPGRYSIIPYLQCDHMPSLEGHSATPGAS